MYMSKRQVFKLLVAYKAAQDPILTGLMTDILRKMDRDNTNVLHIQLPDSIVKKVS